MDQRSGHGLSFPIHVASANGPAKGSHSISLTDTDLG